MKANILELIKGKIHIIILSKSQILKIGVRERILDHPQQDDLKRDRLKWDYT